MRKFLRFLFTRVFWVGIICLAQIALLTGLIIAFSQLSWQIGITFYAIMEVISIILMIYVVSVKGNVAYKVSWLFFIGAIPMIGAVIYLLFGDKRISKRKQKKMAPIVSSLKESIYNTKQIEKVSEENIDAARMSTYIFHTVGIPLFSNTEAQYFSLGDDAWPVMLDELKKAKHYIFLEYFIIAEGKVWTSILDILKQKAKEGLDVRVFYDDFGSVTTVKSNLPKTLEKCGIKCLAYNRIKPVLDIKMNNRNHRKLLIIDGHTGFTGGINLADEYMNLKQRFGHWKDNCIMIKGEAVWGMTSMFLSVWDYSYHNTHEDFSQFHYDIYANELDHIPQSSGYIQPYTDYPFDKEAVSETIYLNMINRAKKYIYITTPYLIISSEMTIALTSAAKSGVNVVLLTPHIPDKPTVFSATRSYYRDLLEGGVKIYEYTPGFVHSKMFIVDDIFGTVGTANLDYRSLFLHLECGCFIYDHPVLKDMKLDFEKSIQISQQWTFVDFKNIPLHKRIYWALLRLFAPLM